MQSVLGLANLHSSLNFEIVLCGDFNCLINSKIMKEITQIFKYHSSTLNKERMRRTRGNAR